MVNNVAHGSSRNFDRSLISGYMLALMPFYINTEINQVKVYGKWGQGQVER